MNVYYGMNFWENGKAAQEVGGNGNQAVQKPKLMQSIRLNREFGWGDISGFVPAIYVGARGMAVDICIRVSNEAFQAFYDKWQPRLEDGLTEAQQKQAAAENPMNIDFGLEVSVNGEKLENDFGCGTCYSKITAEEYQKGGVEEQLVKEYGCDEAFSWCFKRHMCRWKERPEKIHSLELHFIAGQKEYFGTQIELDIDCKGKKYDIIHPVNGKRYELQVNHMVQQEISKEVVEGLKGKMRNWEYPNQYLIISYTIEPELTQEQFRLQDVIGGDRPRNMQSHENAAVSVIGGADGPTSIFIAGKRKEKQEMITVSGIYFETVTHVSLVPIFMEKEREDMCFCMDLQKEENTQSLQ